MEEMTMFNQMIEYKIEIMSYVLVSKYYNKLNYEAVYLMNKQIITDYYQSLEGWESFCLN